jgi:hypothetical protein
MIAYKKYLKYFFIFSALLVLSLLLNYVFVIHSFENISYKEIVDQQLKMQAIWGSALNPDTVSYKYELFKHKKPEIIALGSSISYNFRHEFFNTSFANCGGVMPFLSWGSGFLQEIFKFHRPRLVILTIDFYFFNDRFPKAASEPTFVDRGTGNLMFKLKQPYLWLWQRKLTLAEYFNIVLFNNNRNEITNYNNMGVLAIHRSQGFREDGSYSYAGLVAGFHPGFYDKKFKETLKHIENGTDRFIHGERLAVHATDDLRRILKICQDQGVKLVVIMPPVAPTVFRKMESMPGAYDFIPKLHQYLQSLPGEVYDFLNNQDVKCSDCEFIDGYHAGDVALQKVLLTIIKQNPRSALRDYLNIDLMQRTVKENRGRAMTIYDPSKYNFPEIDFLEIGCRK